MGLGTTLLPHDTLKLLQDMEINLKPRMKPETWAKVLEKFPPRTFDQQYHLDMPPVERPSGPAPEVLVDKVEKEILAQAKIPLPEKEKPPEGWPEMHLGLNSEGWHE